jgi:hypothetical protein
MPAQFTLPPDTRSVGSGNPPADMDGVVDALTAMGTGFNVLNAAFSGGADPTGAADSAAALQACITAAAAAGQPVTIPPGTYKTTATLNCKLDGLVIRAPGGPDNTIISCATSNIPVAQFAGDQQDISGLTFTYATPQTSGQTAANGITFGDDTLGSCFQGNYHELTITSAQTAMAVDPAITTAAGLFSCRIANIKISAYSSSAISLNGNNGNGLVNCTGCVFDNIYISNASGTAASYPVVLQNWDEVSFTQLNIEHCTLSAQHALAFSFVSNATVTDLHCEALTISATGKGLLYASNAGTVTVRGMTAKFNTYSGSASNPVVFFNGTGPTSVIISGFWESGCTVTTPAHPLADFGTATGCYAQVTGVASSQVTATAANAGNTGCRYQAGTPDRWMPQDNNLLTATFDPALATTSNLLIAGTQYLMRFDIRFPLKLSSLWFLVATAGSGASTGSFCGLYNSAGTLLTGSADIAASLTSTGTPSPALTTPQVLTAGTFVWAVILSNLATTQPQLRSGAGSTGSPANVGLTAAFSRWATNGTGRTTLAASITPSANSTSGLTFWCGGS